MNARSVIERRADWSAELGNSLDWVWSLPKERVQCCVTSPPYFGLRAYMPDDHPDRDLEIGREQTPEEYVDLLVELFRGVRRALTPSGVLWLNLGDSFASDDKWGGRTGGKHVAGLHGTSVGRAKRQTGLKSKDLIGIPWMVAFALRADGWYLRQWCPWVCRNKMPESADDRPGSACEMVFLLSKQPDYFFDMEAVRQPSKQPGISIRMGDKSMSRRSGGTSGNASKDVTEFVNPESRNFRNSDLWFDSMGMVLAGQLDGTDDDTLLGFDVNVVGDKAAHFAIMPKKLIRPMVLSGTSERGCCPHCAAPWERIITKERVATRPGIDTKTSGDRAEGNRDPERHVTRTKTVGWQPTCSCPTHEPVPCVVMDPFAGSGNVLAVAYENRRRAIGNDLNPDYVDMARQRVGRVTPNLI